MLLPIGIANYDIYIHKSGFFFVPEALIPSVVVHLLYSVLTVLKDVCSCTFFFFVFPFQKIHQFRPADKAKLPFKEKITSVKASKISKGLPLILSLKIIFSSNLSSK